MITLIVPSRNRAHTLRLVAHSYYRQKPVNEIIFVCDACTDDTDAVLADLARAYPDVRTVILRNETRRGAPFNRIRGYQAASNDYILYCDDDTYMADGYAEICLRKMQETGAAIVSGRLVHKTPDQTVEQAVRAFGNGHSDGPLIRPMVCELRHDARFEGDLYVPFTIPEILTRKDLLERFSYDVAYCRGNSYREETDYQMNLFVNDYDILVTNDTHCIELSRWENRSGGQRMSRLRQLYWSIYYTNYFYQKYYDRYVRRMGLRANRYTALCAFSLRQFYALFIRPARHLGRVGARLLAKPA